MTDAANGRVNWARYRTALLLAVLAFANNYLNFAPHETPQLRPVMVVVSMPWFILGSLGYAVIVQVTGRRPSADKAPLPVLRTALALQWASCIFQLVLSSAQLEVRALSALSLASAVLVYRARFAVPRSAPEPDAGPA